MRVRLNVNKIKSVIKMGLLNKGEHLERVAEEVFVVRRFTTVTKI